MKGTVFVMRDSTGPQDDRLQGSSCCGEPHLAPVVGVERRPTAVGHEFVVCGEIVARLLWVDRDELGRVPGWVLTAPGWPEEQLYRIPAGVAQATVAVRRHRESAVLGIAEMIVVDRLSGLLRRSDATDLPAGGGAPS